MNANQSPSWISIQGRQLVSDGRPVLMQGIGLGNWMLVEHFMIGLPQMDYVMRLAFEEILGRDRAAAFWTAYMDRYYTEADIAAIADIGFNHVRLPFSYRHFESDAQPGQWRQEGFDLVDRIIGWCRKHRIWVLLDLHSAPGCQASDWNAESAHGESLLWDNADFQQRMANLWREIARRYRDEPTVMAYEILNEPVSLYPRQVAAMNAVHHRCIAAIRQVDPRHVIVVNGDKHATDLPALDDATFADSQVMAAFHLYYDRAKPLGKISSFPCVYEGTSIDQDYLVSHTGLATRGDRQRIARPEFLDEFGFGYASPTAGASRQIARGMIAWCQANGVNWNLWHYKDVRAMGLLHMKPATPWLQLLDRIGAGKLHADGDAAVRAYMAQIDNFLPLETKRRQRLSEETRRDLQMQTLWTLVQRMENLTAPELAALGTSFSSDNFEADEQMAAILRKLLHRG